MARSQKATEAQPDEREQSMASENQGRPDNAADPQEHTTPQESTARLSEAQMDSVSTNTGSALADQKKESVRLYQVPETSTDKRLPDETVTINGYTYQIRRGEDVEVPESVAEVLRQSGRI
jgi:hypothetical protein